MTRRINADKKNVIVFKISHLVYKTARTKKLCPKKDNPYVLLLFIFMLSSL